MFYKCLKKQHLSVFATLREVEFEMIRWTDTEKYSQLIRVIGFAELKVRISPAGFGPTSILSPIFFDDLLRKNLLFIIISSIFAT